MLLFVFILAGYLSVISSSTNCSAINSYIQIVSPELVTLTSSKADFAPYIYGVPSTELVTLDTSTDNICNPDGGLNTIVSNKIVLIFTSHGLCSNHFKVYVAQQHNARAVIIANHDASGEVFDIVEDAYLATQGFVTSIPVRGVSHAEGTVLFNAITSGITVMAAFHCFDSHHPSQLCILDTLGDVWYLDGDYQRQEMVYNEYPVYKKEGYVYLLSHLYIFQHVMDGESDMHWSITLDPDFETDRYIRARCAAPFLEDPSLCPVWNATNAFDTDKSIPFSAYSQLSVSTGLCTISDSYLCIESTQSDLRGLDGTYRQFNPNVPFWFRELDDCDTRPGWLLLQDDDFVLLDSLNVWAIAQCEAALGTTDPTSCTHWQSITEDTLIEELEDDDTFTITSCTASESTCNPSIAAPERFCMEKSTVWHGFLEGEYAQTGVVGATYSSVEYMRTEALFYDDEYIDIYVWWFGEINIDEHSWWVISKSSLTTAISHGGDVMIFAYCESKTKSPGECASAWNFYFGSAFHPDPAFEVYDGLCSSGQASEEVDWPEFMCVGFANYTLGSQSKYLSSEIFIGAYEINTTATALSGGVPHWTKPASAQTSSRQMYLYFDGFYGYWQIGYALHVDHGAILFCYQEEDYSPVDCKGWYDAWYTKMDNVYLYSCSEDDMMHSGGHQSDPAVMIGVVLTFVVCCFCIFGCFYYMNVRKKGEVSFTHTEAATSMPTTTGIDREQSPKTEKPAKADFTPLNVESPVSQEESSGDDHGTDFMHKNNAANPVVELEEEKKEKDTNKTMKQSLDDWTTAMIADPEAASRRYSKTNPKEIAKIQNLYKTVMDPLFEKTMKAKKKRERRESMLQDPERIKELYRQVMDPLFDRKKKDNEEEKKQEEPLDPEEIKKLYKKVMDPLYNFEDDEDSDLDEAEKKTDDDDETPAQWTKFDEAEKEMEDVVIDNKPQDQTEVKDENAENATDSARDVGDDDVNVKADDDASAQWTKF